MTRRCSPATAASAISSTRGSRSMRPFPAAAMAARRAEADPETPLLIPRSLARPICAGFDRSNSISRCMQHPASADSSEGSGNHLLVDALYPRTHGASQEVAPWKASPRSPA